MRRFYLNDCKKYIAFCQEDSSWQNHLLDLADKACDNTFIFTDRYEMERCTTPVRFDGKIDWNHIPFDDDEWCFAFNRHTFLLNLAKAFCLTGNDKYRDAWIRLFTDFCDNTAPEGESRRLCWRSLECGIRVENYLRSLEFFEDSCPLDDETKRRLHKLLRHHVEYLLEVHTAFHRLSNWGVLQDHGLFLAAMYLDDAETAAAALDRLAEELSFQTMEDGMHWEQSTMYQAEVLHAAMDSVLIADRFSFPVPQVLRDKTRLLATGLARSLRPDGRCYLFGDSDLIDMRDMVLEAAVIFSDPYLAWMGRGGNDLEFYASFPLDTQLPEARPENDRSCFFKESGNALLALSADTEVRFHCGFHGSGHGHFDQLHFDLFHRGEVLLTDTGRYTYVDKVERRLTKGTQGHNTILVDNAEMASMVDSWVVHDFAEPMFHDAQVSGKVKFVSASHLGYLPLGVVVTRSIVTLADRYIVIFDTVQGKGNHTVETLFHLDEGAALEMGNDSFSVSKNGSRATVHLLTSQELSSQGALMSKRYNELLESVCVKAASSCIGKTLNAYVITLDGEECTIRKEPVFKPLTGKDFDSQNAVGLTIEGKDGRWTVSYANAEEPYDGSLSRCGDAEAYARVFVKHDGEAVEVLKY